MWGKLNSPMFHFNMGLLNLIKIDYLIFLAKLCPPSLLFGWRKGLTNLPMRLLVGSNNQGTKGVQPTTIEVKTKGHIIISYTHGLCESIKKISGRYGIQTHYKGSNTIRNLLVSPKDKDPTVQQKWGRMLVPMWWPLLWWQIYRGTSRTFGERFKAHLKDPSPIHHHSNHTGHPTSQNNLQIIGREGIV